MTGELGGLTHTILNLRPYRICKLSSPAGYGSFSVYVCTKPITCTPRHLEIYTNFWISHSDKIQLYNCIPHLTVHSTKKSAPQKSSSLLSKTPFVSHCLLKPDVAGVTVSSDQHLQRVSHGSTITFNLFHCVKLGYYISF